MKLKDTPTDIAVSASFVAVFLLAFVPNLLLLLPPDLLLAIKALQAKRRAKAKRT